ncbi:hypothetical protein [Nonomuraea sp. NPDC002799]
MLRQPHFTHAPDVTGAGPALRAVTRYLCAAAYLDVPFREKVRHELLGDPHRAVAHSHDGLDVEPVLRHCLRGRRLTLARDVLLVLALIAALAAEPTSTAALLALLLPVLHYRAKAASRPDRRPSALWYPLTIVLLLVAFVWAAITARTALSPGALEWLNSVTRGLPVGTGAAGFVVVAAVILGVFRGLVVRTLAGGLRAGAWHRPPRVYGPWARRRIRYLAAAQHGNIALYAGDDRSDGNGAYGGDETGRMRAAARSPFVMFTDDPAFLGAGLVAQVWSISAELDLQDGNRLPSSIGVDPVRLHHFVRGRMESMRDEVRNDSERIRSLTTHDHVIARGLISRPRAGQAQSLVDGRSWLPYSLASSETVETLIRHPQAGLRHYQLVVIGSERDSVSDGGGRQIVPAEDQEVVVSAFIHLAVEGRMLYTEFVSTVLPPIRREFHVIDQLPRGPLAYTLRFKTNPPTSFARLASGALPRVVAALWDAADLRRLLRTPRLKVMHDYGARRSVRELGASGSLSVTQRLDAFKYTKLISQRLTEAVIDFLDEEGVDTTRYRQQATSVMMTTITNSQFGNGTAIGNLGPVRQNGPPSPNPAGGPHGTAAAT